MKIKKFTFNSFQENTYIISSKKKCMIIDPGCQNTAEKDSLVNYIEENELIPVELINTHCHIDHIFGNNFISRKYNLTAKIHRKDLPLINKAVDIAKIYNVELDPPPLNVNFLKENDVVTIGETSWQILFTPGHAPGHICLLNRLNKKIIVGDVLFFMSIGRTDLPGCNHNDLINSIKNKLFVLDDDIEVYCGHGNNTTIGFEKNNNPFLKV